MRRALTALLVVLAGCSGLPGATSPTPSPVVDGTPTPSATPASADLDADAVVAAHLAALNESGSFRSTYVSVTRGPDETYVNRQVYAVDADANRRLYVQNTSTDGRWSRRTTYTNGSHTYYRTVEPDDANATLDARYDRLWPHPPDVGPVDVETGKRPATIRAAVSSIDWRRANSSAGATRYVADGVDRFPEDPLGGGVELRGSQARANATLVVGEDGVVRRLALDYRGVRHDGDVVERRLEVRFDRVGRRVARPPTWLDEAREVEPDVNRVHRVGVTNERDGTTNASVVVRRDGGVVEERNLTLAPGDDVEVLAATGVGNYSVVVRSAGEVARESFVRTNRTRNCFGDRFVRFRILEGGVDVQVAAETGGCPY